MERRIFVTKNPMNLIQGERRLQHTSEYEPSSPPGLGMYIYSDGRIERLGRGRPNIVILGFTSRSGIALARELLYIGQNQQVSPKVELEWNYWVEDFYQLVVHRRPESGWEENSILADQYHRDSIFGDLVRRLGQAT